MRKALGIPKDRQDAEPEKSHRPIDSPASPETFLKGSGRYSEATDSVSSVRNAVTNVEGDLKRWTRRDIGSRVFQGLLGGSAIDENGVRKPTSAQVVRRRTCVDGTGAVIEDLQWEPRTRRSFLYRLLPRT